MAERRTARIKTPHSRAAALAAAVRPDNTDDVDTRAVDGAVVTEITRETTGSLATTADDYVRNLRAGARLLADDPQARTDTTTNTDTTTDDT
ncbi:KEOPS complex Pcc1-like subunit [Halobacteriales archaeon QH_10_67_13]|nr:MAG: KEOPS complex Pcc1-like subunit [Halobacteriales archaeon QH_10_67_13]